MKRRPFLPPSALSSLPVVAKAGDVEPEADGWETIHNEALSFQAVSGEGKAISNPERFRNASFSRFPVTKRPLGDLSLFPLITAHFSLGTSSPIRWIVSKSGTVLRHRHCPPHEC